MIDFDFKHDHDLEDDLDSRTYLNVKFSALSIYEVKSGGSHLKNRFDLQMTLIIDLKVMAEVTIGCLPRNSTTFVLKVFFHLP